VKLPSQTVFLRQRFYFLLGVIICIIAALILRMVDLTIFKKHFLEAQGNARILRIINEPAFRGMITDRDHNPLAISALVYSIWINPQEFIIDKKNILDLAKILSVPAPELEKLITTAQDADKEFIYLKRDVSPAIAAQIKALDLPGIFCRESYKRYYPEGEIAAQLIGFTNVDDKGTDGLELEYDKWLAGLAGKKLVIRDRMGRSVADVQTYNTQQPGNDLVLSIARRIQYLAYQELMAGVIQNQADYGSAVILNVKTGEILAMVNYPSFNPNKLAMGQIDNFRNRAVTDVFEPGSTIKAFSIARALESGRYQPNTVINTYPGWFRVGHNLVRDEHNNGLLTVTQILQLSSNVGTAKMLLSLPSPQLWELLHRVGFGENTGIGFPGEQSGSLVNRRVWAPFALATLSFGYGVSVTALQLAHAYATLANGGIKVPLSLLRVDQPPAGEREMDAKLAQQMLGLLEAVLTKGGTGAPATIPGYHIAGKTGTAWMLGKHGYEKRHYVSSFVGIAPASAPQLVVAVIIHDPRGKNYYGGAVSAPIFKKIMAGTLRILDIPPDNLTPAAA
jgi:cell division protein FtsI (penicillin-binding protein 3)